MAEGSSWEEIRGRVLDAVVPKRAEVESVEGFARRVVEDLGVGLAEAGVRAVVEVHGSVARGTWIAGDRDFDVFIVLAKTILFWSLSRLTPLRASCPPRVNRRSYNPLKGACQRLINLKSERRPGDKAGAPQA